MNISMHVGKEVQGTVYQNSEGGQMLNVLPYDNAETYEDQGKVTGMGTGHSGEITLNYTSKDGTFSGKAVSAFHTHPGHPKNPTLGFPVPSPGDIDGAIVNGLRNALTSFPYHIYSKKSMTVNGQTSNHSIYGVTKTKFGQSFFKRLASPWKP